MVITEQIFRAVIQIIGGDFQREFKRKNVRDILNVPDLDWKNSYSPVFQGMREDQPGGAPSVAKGYRGVFRRVSQGVYVLTSKGIERAGASQAIPTWRESVLQALNEIALSKASRIITRKEIIDIKLNQIVNQTHSVGETPEQTLSRVLQELRKSKYISFVEPGNYLLLDQEIEAGSEDLTDSKSTNLLKQINCFSKTSPFMMS